MGLVWHSLELDDFLRTQGQLRDNLENIEFRFELDVWTYVLDICGSERRSHVPKSVFGTVSLAIFSNVEFGPQMSSGESQPSSSDLELRVF